MSDYPYKDRIIRTGQDNSNPPKFFFQICEDNDNCGPKHGLYDSEESARKAAEHQIDIIVTIPPPGRGIR